MADPKPKRKRRAVAARKAPPTLFDKYGSILKLFANYGLGGLVVGYLLVYTIPDGQKSFEKALEKQSDQSREDRKSALAHGERAVDRIAGSIDGLKASWSEVQQKTQGNQRELISAQLRTNELLENRIEPTSTAISPEWVPVKPKTKASGQ